MKIIPLILLLALLGGCASLPNGIFGKKQHPPAALTKAWVIEKEASLTGTTDTFLCVLVVACFYRQHWFTGGSLLLAALLLPFLAAFVSVWGAWIVAGLIVLFAIVAFIHYKAVIEPVVSDAIK